MCAWAPPASPASLLGEATPLPCALDDLLLGKEHRSGRPTAQLCTRSWAARHEPGPSP